MTAKQRFLEKAEVKQKKHPITGPKLVSFILAMVFFGISVIYIGTVHRQAVGWAGSLARAILSITAIITLQLSVIFSALAVTSTRYVLHSIGCASLAASLALDISLGIYYLVFTI